MKREEREGLQVIVDEGRRRLLNRRGRAIAPKYTQAAAMLQLDLMQREAGEEPVAALPFDEPEKTPEKKSEPAKKSRDKKGKGFDIDLQE